MRGILEGPAWSTLSIVASNQPQTSPETVGAAHADYQRNGCDSLLAFGGGSTIDTAKGAAGLRKPSPGPRSSPSSPHSRVLPSRPQPRVSSTHSFSCSITSVGMLPKRSPAATCSSVRVMSEITRGLVRLATGPAACGYGRGRAVKDLSRH